MKKFSLFICLIIVLNIFSACGMKEEADTQSSSREKETSEIVSVVSSEENEASASEYTSTEESEKESVSKEESVPKNVAKEESEPKNVSKEDKANSTPKKITAGKGPLVPKYVHYRTGIDRFIGYLEWPCLSKDFDMEYEYNKPLAEWAYSQEEVLILRPKDEKHFISITGLPRPAAQVPLTVGYTFCFTDFYAALRYLNDEEKNEDLLSLVNRYDAQDLMFFKKKSKWGEYYTDKTGKEIFLRIDDYLVNLYSNDSKIDISLDGFKFEYVPLERSCNSCPHRPDHFKSSSSKNSSSETQSSDISSKQNASSQNTTSSEETSTQ